MDEREWFTRAATPSLALWGKARPGLDSPCPAHPLLFHMVDVAAVAEAMLHDVVPSAVAGELARSLDCSQDEAASVLCFAVALHDLGKASPAFQRKWAPAVSTLPAKGLAMPRPSPSARHHGTLSVAFAAEAMERHLGLAPLCAWRLARAVAAHHGEFPGDADANRPPGLEEGAHAAWANARSWLVEALAVLFRPRRLTTSEQMDPSFALLLAGLTAVADWLGSMADVFAYEPPDVPAPRYLELARGRARLALDRVRFTRLASPPARRFAELFDRAPWPLHEAVAAAMGDGADPPAIVIIEAPMGEGKTEAALQIADALASGAGRQGLFFGLPTQATANQMLGRVERFLGAAYPAAVNLHLVHGDAAQSDEYARLASVHARQADGGPRAEAWFARKKRALLAHVAVGTIDQALLGVLRVGHAFVRLYGLAGKTVILDEVHAYDAYTSRLLDRLVAWLRALGATTVVLSATLPRRRRQELLAAAGARELVDAPYPRLSLVGRDRVSVRRVPSRRPATIVTIEPAADDLGATLERLTALSAAGGCAGWICNTIARAQDAFRRACAARAAGALPQEVELLLLHSRFPAAARRQREATLTGWLGPSGARPRRAIVVGTQVFEQSLDIDFDVLASDLAPVDLLLQRAGRLHRHARARPGELAAPRLIIVGGAGDTAPAWARQGVVYDAFPQLRTSEALRGRTSIALPDDIEPLVERVYRDPDAEDAPEVVAAADRSRKELEQHTWLAEASLLPAPDRRDDPFADFAAPLEEDAPELHESLKARTRLGAEGLDVVCLHRNGRGEVFTDAGLRLPLELGRVPDAALVRRLLDASVSLSNPRIVRALLAEAAPSGWSGVPTLRHRRALRFDQGRASIGGMSVIFDEALGLVFEREED